MASSHWQVWSYSLRFILPFAFAWMAIYLRRWQKHRKEEAAQGWPSVEGPIGSVQVKAVPKTTLFVVTVEYSYFVGEYRSGKYLHEFTREEAADEFARQMKNKRVTIRYNEAKPDLSVLEESTLRQYLMLAPSLR